MAAADSPWGIVYQGQLSKVVPFMECVDDALAVDGDIDGTSKDDVPRLAFRTLLEH